VTCVATTTFRLLDERVGWDPDPSVGLSAIAIEEGSLQLSRDQSHVGADRVAPAQLAWMCEQCTWWLGTERGILRLGPCDATFASWSDIGPVRALAARGTRLAAVVAGEGIRIFDVTGRALIGTFELPQATAVSLSPWGAVIAGDAAGVLYELDLSGVPCVGVQTRAPIERIAHPAGGACRTIVVHEDDTLSVVDAGGGTVTPGEPSLLDELAGSGVVLATDAGFCVASRGCFDWDGLVVGQNELGPGDDRFAVRGQYLSEPLDSGIPSCRWHRVRIDADVPASTTLQVAIATTDGPTAGRVAQLAAEGPWDGMPAGDPHPDDWFEARTGVVDVTIRAPAGRYAYVRVRLTGDGTATPRVHQVRLDMPRHTSLDDLPAIYAADDEARDFTERFLSLFDAQLEEVDEVVGRFDALLDPEALPDDALGWLAGLLGLGFEAEMSVAQRRALIEAAPDLYRRRGTPSGLVDTLRIALGIDAVVQELGPERPWGAAGLARLGSARLFGRSRARVRLGSSRLGTAPLISRGTPDDDARLAGAHRIVVSVGPRVDRALVERVVRSQTPAHVVATVRMHEPGFVLTELRLGVDTVLLAPAPAVVGTTRLGRGGVLRRGRASTLAVVGQPLIVGSNTRME
jgi:phage tail-like protein